MAVSAPRKAPGNERQSHAYITMVALDQRGGPALVPPLEATTPTEKRRMREAELRRANRLAERAQITEHRRNEA